jgi:hypothetical protein
MKFFIQSDKFIGFFQTPGVIQVGDSIFADSRKYSDQSLTTFLGPSYAHYSVVNSVPVGSQTFRVKAMSTRILDFLEDGIVTVSGMSDQVFTLGLDNQIVDSKVLSNTLTITGGSGKFEKACGSYDVETVSNGIHRGTLNRLCSEKPGKNTIVIWIVVSLLVLALILGVVTNYKN